MGTEHSKVGENSTSSSGGISPPPSSPPRPEEKDTFESLKEIVAEVLLKVVLELQTNKSENEIKGMLNRRIDYDKVKKELYLLKPRELIEILGEDGASKNMFVWKFEDILDDYMMDKVGQYIEW